MQRIAESELIINERGAVYHLNLRPGSPLTVRAGTTDFALRVAGPVQRARPGQRFGVMDVGALQWRFGQLGKLSRVDLKLQGGVNRAQFEALWTNVARFIARRAKSSVQ